MPMALRENRVWGARERLFERVLPLLSERALAELVESASICDGLVKGLKHPHWPDDPWAGLQRLALMVCERVGVASGAGRQARRRDDLRWSAEHARRASLHARTGPLPLVRRSPPSAKSPTPPAGVH